MPTFKGLAFLRLISFLITFAFAFLISLWLKTFSFLLEDEIGKYALINTFFLVIISF
jgi:hypothetical protein